MDILNYLVLNKQLITGGQPSKDSFEKLSKKGVVVVINLLPSHQNPIGNEEFLVAENNMDYIHIPVDWDNPKETDFNSFVMAMKKHQGKKIFVHCAMNMRVSAFIYLSEFCTIIFIKKKQKNLWKRFGNHQVIGRSS